jgi:hypothetical protein
MQVNLPAPTNLSSRPKREGTDATSFVWAREICDRERANG